MRCVVKTRAQLVAEAASLERRHEFRRKAEAADLVRRAERLRQEIADRVRIFEIDREIWLLDQMGATP